MPSSRTVGCVHVPADGEDLVAAEAGHRPVGRPVDDRVQRAEIVRLGPGGVRLVGEGVGEQRLAPVLGGDELEPLGHLPLGQVRLRQHLQSLPQVRRRDQLDDLLRAVVPPADPAGGDRRCRGLVRLIEGVVQERHLRGVERDWRGASGRISAEPGRGGTAMMRASMPSDGVLGLDGLRVLHDVVQVAFPARTLRISSSSASTSYLPISDATSPSAVCASCSFSMRRLSTRRSPENASVVGVEQQGRDLRRVPLPVPVDAAVALLDPDQGPRDVVVDELVALRVQVHALAGQVAGDEHADGRGFLLEAFDDGLLLDVGQAAVQDDRLVGSSLRSVCRWLLQPLQRGGPARRRSPLARAVRADADLVQVAQQLRRTCRNRCCSPFAPGLRAAAAPRFPAPGRPSGSCSGGRCAR